VKGFNLVSHTEIGFTLDCAAPCLLDITARIEKKYQSLGNTVLE
jgi:hypothetical protein